MSNPFDDMRTAISSAKTTLRAADNCAEDMALLLRGRLRKVDNGYILQLLKRELTHFNAHTREWND